MSVLITVPEQHAGNPISIAEAVDRLAGLHLLPGYERVLTMNGCCDVHQGAWLILLGCLTANGVQSFVQSGGTGRYARLPADYWSRYTVRDDPPSVFDGINEPIASDPELLGQPLVVWVDGIEPAFAVLADLVGAAQKGRSDAVGVVVPIRGSPTFTRNTKWEEHAAWYQARVALAPPAGYTREEDEASCKEVGIGRDRFRELRRQLAPVHWGNSGPKTRPNN